MAEIVSSWGMDWTGFKRGSEAVRAEARRAGRDVDSFMTRQQGNALQSMGKRMLGFGGIGGGVGLAGIAAAAPFLAMKKSIDEYAKSSREAGREVEQALSFTKTKASAAAWGADLVMVFKPIPRLLDAVAASVIDFGRAWGAGMSHLFGSSPALVHEFDRLKDLETQLRKTGEAAMDAALKYQSQTVTAEVRAKMAGNPLADVTAREWEEFYRHRGRNLELLELRRKDSIKANAEQTWEDRLNIANVAGLEAERTKIMKEQADKAKTARAAAQQAKDTAQEQARTQQVMLDIEHERERVAGMRARGESIAAARLEGELALRERLQKLAGEFGPGTSFDAYVAARERILRDGAAATQRMVEEARARHAEETRVVDVTLRRARVQRLEIDGHRTQAMLLGTRLDFEDRIAEVMKSQVLSLTEQKRAADSLAGARDSVLRAVMDAELERVTDEYWGSMSRRTYRGVDPGLGYRSQAVFGPAGHTESLYVAGGGRTAVEKNLDQLLQATEAIRKVADDLNRKTPEKPVGAVG